MSAEILLLPRLFRSVAARHPDRVAVDIPPATQRPQRLTRTYQELEGRADAIAAVIGPLVNGEAIVPVVIGRDDIDLLPAQIGCLFAGVAYTCLDPLLPDERLGWMLSDCAPTIVLSISSEADRVQSLVGESCRVVIFDDIDEVADKHPEPSWFGPSTLAYVIYTSGTTGRPKGVMIEHASVASLIHSDIERFGIGPGDRCVLSSSPSYDSSVEEIWLALSTGATVVAADQETARLGPDLIGWLRDERISVFCPPPTLLRATGCDDPGPLLPDLRLLYVGGEALDTELARIWGGPFHLENGYGPTETTVTAVRARMVPGRPIVIGRPVPGAGAHVLDEEGIEVPEGDEGELCLSGVGLARGYLNLPEETARRFVDHPRYGRVYRTGDLARREPDGNLSCLGRIDSQVKIRGHRIELEEIEVRLAGLEEVREAACLLQGEGGGKTLSAWIVPESGYQIDALGIREALSRTLPPHMVPSRFGVLEALPRSVGDKLARSRLEPVPEGGDGATTDDPCRGHWEEAVETAMAGVLGLKAPLPATADFFDLLEGDSLRAALLVSVLREQEMTEHATVKLLYEHPNIRAFAAALSERASDDVEVKPRRLPRQRLSPWPVGILQAAILLAGVAVASALAWALAFEALPRLLKFVDPGPLLIVIPVVLGAFGIVGVPLSILAVVVAKRVLIGRYRPCREPVYGSFYLRNWIVQRLVRLIPWRLFAGTEFQIMALRMLGARIGRRVHIHRGVNLLDGGWDLLEIGDDVTVSQDAALRLIDLDDGEVVCAPVVLGDGATVDIRAGVAGGASMGPGAKLGALSVLSSGCSIPGGQFWDGVPAAPAGETMDAPPLDRPAAWSPLRFAFLAVLAGFLLDVLFGLPMLILLWGAVWWWNIDSAVVVRWLADPVLTSDLVAIVCGAASAGSIVGLVLQALFCRALGPIPTGCVSRWSGDFLRGWFKSGAVIAANRWLSGSLFWPPWLRLAGMKIGFNSEVSTIIDVIPEHIEIGQQSFFADGIYLGGPVVHRGRVTYRKTTIGDCTFLGNHAVVHAGARVPGEVLLGICTRSHESVRPGTSWFGIPAFELPRRQVVEMSRELTHEPNAAVYLRRLAWESARFLVPLVALGAAWSWLWLVAGMVKSGTSVPLLLCELPLATAAAGAVPIGFVLLLKWLLLGRTRPGQHAFWSGWCCRWDFLYVSWGMLARGIASALEGTPWIHFWLRAMGVRLGRGVILGGGFAQVVDPDMLRIDDGATVNGLFQAHSFEDRVLKMDVVRIRREARVHDGSVLLYGADIGEGAAVMHHSVVMKHEKLLPERCYEGSPTAAQKSSESVPPA